MGKEIAKVKRNRARYIQERMIKRRIKKNDTKRMTKFRRKGNRAGEMRLDGVINQDDLEGGLEVENRSHWAVCQSQARPRLPNKLPEPGGGISRGREAM